MTWLLSAFVTALASAVVAATFTLLRGSELMTSVTPSPLAVLAAQAGVFVTCRLVLAIYLGVLLARPAVRTDAPSWLGTAVHWLAEAWPRWLLGYAAILGSIAWGTWPLLLRGPDWTALWGVGALLALAFAAAALTPDPAWRLALPVLDEVPE
jgi:hypothetical protein